MRNILISVVAILISPTIFADKNKYYIESSIGNYDVDNVDTVVYSGTSSGITFSNLQGNLKYDEDSAFSFEVGMQYSDNLRVGLAYTDLDVSFQSATVSGSATNGTTTINASATVTAADVSALGLTWDNEADVYMLNFYYDFININPNYTPFLSLGIGQADITNTNDDETAVSFAVGVNMDISPSMYAGIKVMKTEIDGPTDKLGLSYDDIEVSSYSFQLGYKF